MTDFGFSSVVRGLNSVLVTKVQGYSTRWAAPEVIMDGDRITQEADVYSFSMVVIEVSPLSFLPSNRREGIDVCPLLIPDQGFYRNVSVQRAGEPNGYFKDPGI